MAVGCGRATEEKGGGAGAKDAATDAEGRSALALEPRLAARPAGPSCAG